MSNDKTKKRRISEQIDSEFTDYQDNPIEVSAGQKFNQFKNVKRINCYLNDEFYEAENNDFIFWNVSVDRVNHYKKNIKLNTKDFMPVGRGSTNFFQAWVLGIKFKNWAKDRDVLFGNKLDELAEGLASYGSVIWKKYKDGKKTRLDEVDLTSVAFDTSVAFVHESDHFCERHYLTEYQLRSKADVWDNVETVIDTVKTGEPNPNQSDNKPYKSSDGIQYYEINERWGYWYNDKGKQVYMHHLVAGKGDTEVILVSDEKKENDFPYRDFHIGKYRKRWQRIGVVERLYPIQERANTLVNQNAATTEIASMLLLRTNDPNTYGNVLTGLRSGDIINSEDLQQIGIDNRFLSGFIAELDRLESKADRLCNTPDIITGDKMPSGAPFRGLVLYNNSAKSLFKTLKEAIGEKISTILLEDILPEEVKSWNAGEFVEMIEDETDLEAFNKAIRISHKLGIAKDLAIKGEMLNNNEWLMLDDIIEQKLDKKQKIRIPKGFFNFKYGFKMDPTGDIEDKEAMNDAIYNAITLLEAQPDIQRHPLFKQYLANNNITPYKLTMKMMSMAGTGQKVPQQKQSGDALMSQAQE